MRRQRHHPEADLDPVLLHVDPESLLAYDPGVGYGALPEVGTLDALNIWGYAV